MDRDCGMYEKGDYQRHYENLRSRFPRSQDKFQTNFVNGKYMSLFQSFKPNNEFYKFHNYGHISHNFRFHKSFTPNTRYIKVWRGKKMQENQVNEKVSTIMVSGFVKEKGHDESIGTLENVKVQDDQTKELVHMLF